MLRRRHRQAMTLRQVLKPRLVEEVFDQRRVGNDETKRLLEALAVARDEQRLRVFLVKQDRTRVLRFTETHSVSSSASGSFEKSSHGSRVRA